MKVLAIGLNKTGTKSLCLALGRMGLNSNHIGPYGFNLSVYQAIKAQRPILDGLEEYDSLQDIWLHNGISHPSWGADNFWSARFKKSILKSIMGEYPDLLFIHNRRDLDSWLASRERHIEYNNVVNLQEGRVLDPWTQFNRDECVREYEEHEQLIGELFSDQADRILDFNLFHGDGYPELGRFLNKPIVLESMPHPDCPYHEYERLKNAKKAS